MLQWLRLHTSTHPTIEMFMSSADRIAWPRPRKIVGVIADPFSANIEMEEMEMVVPIIV